MAAVLETRGLTRNFGAIVAVDDVSFQLREGELLALIGLNSLFGLGVGAAMLMAALETGNVATVTILSSTTPVMILPFIWARTGRRPAPAAWVGAILVVICTMLIAI